MKKVALFVNVLERAYRSELNMVRFCFDQEARSDDI